MGKNFHYTIPKFIEEKLDSHNKIKSWTGIDKPEDDHFIYHVKRTDNMTDVNIILSDEYTFTLNDYYSKPEQVSFYWVILIARPEAGYSHTIAEIAKGDGISIGKFGALMELLNIEQHWEYIPQERQEQK